MEEEKEWNDYRIPFSEEETWKKYLKDNGFVVISGYLSSEDCLKAVDRLWDTMVLLSEGKLSKEDTSTHSKSENYPFNLHGGMIQYLGHSQIQWDLRKRCKLVYEKLWGTSDLSCSFDGLCFMNGKRKYAYTAPDSFLHTDQAPMKTYFWCYQGLINLVDCGPDSGGFVVIPRSHLKHKDYFKENNLTGYKNWYVVPEHHKNKPPFLPVEKLVLKAGDFVIWDGRTFHCNTTPSNDDMRICTYVAMIPSKAVPPLAKQKRKQYFQQNKSTNHHPGDGMKLALDCPRFLQDKDHFLQIVQKANNVDKTDPAVLAMI